MSKGVDKTVKINKKKGSGLKSVAPNPGRPTERVAPFVLEGGPDGLKTDIPAEFQKPYDVGAQQLKGAKPGQVETDIQELTDRSRKKAPR